jgi:hypothetical protein
VPLMPRPFTIAVYRRPHDPPADGARFAGVAPHGVRRGAGGTEHPV